MERWVLARLGQLSRALAMSALFACADGSTGEATNQMAAIGEDDGGGADTASDAASHEAVRFGEVYAIIAAKCGGGQSGCHVTGKAADLLLPDEAAAHAALVDIESRKCAGELLVASGDADASVLVHALEGSSSCVKPMPLGRDLLPAAEIALIRAWIDDGAPPD